MILIFITTFCLSGQCLSQNNYKKISFTRALIEKTDGYVLSNVILYQVQYSSIVLAKIKNIMGFNFYVLSLF